MESLNTIANALILGAMGQQWAATHDAIDQYYWKLKTILEQNYPAVSLAKLQESPESRGIQFILKDDLSNAGAANDDTLVQTSIQLIESVKQYNPELIEKSGLTL